MSNDLITTPHDLRTEQSVLGSMLQSKVPLLMGLDLLQPDSFYSSEHRIIFEAIQELSYQGLEVDILTVTDQLTKRKQIAKVGGPVTVANLTNHLTNDALFEQHCIMLRENHMKRLQIDFGRMLVRKAGELNDDAFEINEYMADKVHEISKLTQVHKQVTNSEHAVTLVKRIERAKAAQGVTGLSTGIHEQDIIFGGWQPTDMIVMAARPGMGKTSKMLSEVIHQVIYEGKRIAVFSLEMSAQQLFARCASMVTEIDAIKFRNGEMSDEDWQTFHSRINLLITDNLVIIDDCYHIHDIRTRAKKERMDAGLDGIYIDYLQIADGVGKSRENQISYISRNCKMLAKELEVPVIALSQLSREVERRGDRRPKLADLRESGAIEQDADVVVFLHRPSYYGEGSVHLAWLIIAKNRHGTLKDVELLYIHKRTQFMNPDNSEEWIS